MSSGLNSLAAVIWEDLVKSMSWSVTITEGRQVKFWKHLRSNFIVDVFLKKLHFDINLFFFFYRSF